MTKPFCSISTSLIFGAFVGLLGPSLSQAQIAFSKIEGMPPATDAFDSRGTSFVDLDNDGDLDLFVVNSRNRANNVYINDGSGVFTSISAGSLGTDAFSTSGNCWSDFDNDGDVDVMTTGVIARLYVNEGDLTFAGRDNLLTFGIASIPGWACAWADYDRDGYVDLIVTHPAGFVGPVGPSNFLFRNKGDGTFENITSTPITNGLAAYTVGSWSDFDMDGDMDLFIGSGPASNTPGPDFLFRNMLTETGSPTFERLLDQPLANTNRDGQVFSWVDYDNDRDLDVLITNWGGGLGGMRDELYRNDSGAFTKVTSGDLPIDRFVSLGASWGDYDNDGDLDVFVTDGTAGSPNRMYENDNGSFRRITAGAMLSDRSVSWGSSAGDIDGDGDLDLYVANTGGAAIRNFLYRNDLDNGNHWLIVRTTGQSSNASGVGARVHVRAIIRGTVVWQMREISSQNTFNGHDSMEAHFGLGDAVIADSVVVEWPSGVYDGLSSVSSDQHITISEGAHPVATEKFDEIPEPFFDVQLYPDPLTTTAKIEYYLPSASSVELNVFDLLGRSVRSVFSGHEVSGKRTHDFDARGLTPGFYILRLKTQSGANARPLRILR